MPFSWPPSYYHFFGIAIFSSGNIVFFRTFLYFESIHKIPVRHSKIIYISGIRQQNILNFTSYCRSRCTLLHSKFIFKKITFFEVLSPLQRDKSGFVLLPWRSHFWSLSNNQILILNSANWSVLRIDSRERSVSKRIFPYLINCFFIRWVLWLTRRCAIFRKY